jgi:hypothetical protein
MRVSPDDVRGAYRFILGREPESEAVVASHQKAHASVEAMRVGFLSSEEFRAQGFLAGRTVPVEASPLVVETSTTPETLRTIVAKTADYWEAIGKTAPHFSVLTFPYYTPDRIAEMEDPFLRNRKGRSRAAAGSAAQDRPSRGRLSLVPGIWLRRRPRDGACGHNLPRRRRPGRLPFASSAGSGTHEAPWSYKCQLPAGDPRGSASRCQLRSLVLAPGAATQSTAGHAAHS